MYPVGGSQYFNILLFGNVYPEAVIELKVQDVVVILESCLLIVLLLISVCENICVFVYTSDELAFVFNRLCIVL